MEAIINDRPTVVGTKKLVIEVVEMSNGIKMCGLFNNDNLQMYEILGALREVTLQVEERLRENERRMMADQGKSAILMKQ